MPIWVLRESAAKRPSVCVCVSHSVPKSFPQAGDQAGCIVAWSTKLAMHPRIWKWDAMSTYLLKTVVYAVTPLFLFVPHILVWGSSFLSLIPPPAAAASRHRDNTHRDNTHRDHNTEITHTEITHTETTHTETTHTEITHAEITHTETTHNETTHTEITHTETTPRPHTQRQHTPRPHRQRSHFDNCIQLTQFPGQKE